MLRRYEVLMLAVPEVTKDEITLIEKLIDDVARRFKGSMLSFERWGKYKLAYPVAKNSYGVYLLSRFELPNGTKALEEIRTIFAIKLNLIVMRNIVQALDLDKPLTYQRPKSLEEAPDATDSRTFIKDHKQIEGLISAVDLSGKGAKNADVAADLSHDDLDQDVLNESEDE